ncbi:MAG: LacI family transcriptional regulator [Clostridiales bacterium]|nr:LacI family transcriptional regulator [Clostridiales bacterium]
MSNINIEKLAQLANVSIGTVSKAFSGSKEISEKTRNKIFALAKKHDCFEKYYKAKREKKVVAVICPELKSPYYVDIVSRIEKLLNDKKVIMALYISNFEAKKETEIISYLLSSKTVDGIMIIASSTLVKFNKDVAIVAINTSRKNSQVDCVNVAFKDTLIETVKYLKDCGHTNIAFIGESLTKSRLNLFNIAMNENALIVNPNWIFIEKTRFEQAGKCAIDKIMQLTDKPTAIICAYDNIALGAIDAIKKHGKSVPEDFSIIGIDDIPISSHSNVSLTSIKSNNAVLCDIAVDLVLKKIESKFFSLREKINLKTELVIRDTVKKIN